SPAAGRRVRDGAAQQPARSRSARGPSLNLQEPEDRQSESAVPRRGVQPPEPRELRDVEFGRAVQRGRHANPRRLADYAHGDDLAATATGGQVRVLNFESTELYGATVSH